jgi:hypothetical protein
MVQEEWRFEDEVEEAGLVLASGTPVLVNVDTALESLCVVLVRGLQYRSAEDFAGSIMLKLPTKLNELVDLPTIKSLSTSKTRVSFWS